MIATVWDMARSRDASALDDLWAVLGGEGALAAADRHETLDELAPGLATEAGDPFRRRAALLVSLIHDVCGSRVADPYSAERGALAELAQTFRVNPAGYPDVDVLEDAIVDAMASQVRNRLEAMGDDERRRFVAGMVRRMSNDERIRLVDRVLGDFDQMGAREQKAFIAELANELEVEEDAVEDAIAGGAAALLPLLLAKEVGFSLFLFTTKVMFVASSGVGVTSPFVVYQMKNKALGWLLGPWGMLVTAGLSAGWFAVKSWRRRERFRKLSQLVVYTSGWRNGPPLQLQAGDRAPSRRAEGV